ncbi:ABC transporter substrate-binding protein [Limnobacter humi]|uniref:ABC transporter substrate-binding protein n=1 Tax=Limnobacter humi TaxID=1778671 RepID=A0ABT1WGX3_9BURK|nr:ABC transporter substrate-binding protein [Limnobacter humi]MCQ8896764.1 ABC transporter substrate-binding protein [Limnobacter humi]
MHTLKGPQRIVCLTEETTEWLYLLGEEHRIVGISGYTVRPKRARLEKPKVSAFLSAKIDQILDLKPDCVFGFSDLQADIAAQLIRHGIQVTVFNQRSIPEILDMLFQVASMVNAQARGLELLGEMQRALDTVVAESARLHRQPKVYFEEWDTPAISAIQWVSELITVAGGVDIFPELARESLGKNRIIANTGDIIARQPDLIIGSWCGKKFRPEQVVARPGWGAVPAVQAGHVYEIKSPLILQPGPACLTDGLQALKNLIHAWAYGTLKPYHTP